MESREPSEVPCSDQLQQIEQNAEQGLRLIQNISENGGLEKMRKGFRKNRGAIKALLAGGQPG